MTETRGDCFEVAASFVLRGAAENIHAGLRISLMLDEQGPWRVVHGLPIGRGGEVLGHRYWHAWIEMLGHPRIFPLPLVFDYSNGHEMKTPRTTYYKAGTLDEDYVFRYTLREARRLLNETGHSGPWVPGYRDRGRIRADGELLVPGHDTC